MSVGYFDFHTFNLITQTSKKENLRKTKIIKSDDIQLKK